MKIQNFLLSLGLDLKRDYLFFRVFVTPIFFILLNAIFARKKLKNFLDENAIFLSELENRYPNDSIVLRSQFLSNWICAFYQSYDSEDFPKPSDQFWKKWNENPSCRTLLKNPNSCQPSISQQE
jgi:hypothetical protein